MDKEVKLVDQKISLDSVIFRKKDSFNGNLKVVSIDHIEDLKITESGISFAFERTVSLDPNALFDVSVRIVYTGKFDTKSMDLIRERNFQLDRNEIEKIVNNTTIASNASLIISFLTSFNGNNPLITSPYSKISPIEK